MEAVVTGTVCIFFALVLNCSVNQPPGTDKQYIYRGDKRNKQRSTRPLMHAAPPGCEMSELRACAVLRGRLGVWLSLVGGAWSGGDAGRLF